MNIPMHDWSSVPSGVYHNFHVLWLSAITNRLNAGLLPPGKIAIAEQIIGGPETDVVKLQLNNPASIADVGSSATLTHTPPRPKTQFVISAEGERYANKSNRVVVRHSLGKVVAVVELVSPGNKDSRHALRSFVEKTVGLLCENINLLIVDPFPPGPRDPQGIHQAIWDEIGAERFELPVDRQLIQRNSCYHERLLVSPSEYKVMKKKASVSTKAAIATPDIQEQVRALGGALGTTRNVPRYAVISDAISIELTQLLSTLLPLHSLSMYKLGKKVSAKVFAPLAALTNLKDLTFQECTLTGAQLEFCSQLEMLERIVFNSCSVDDDALANFSNSKKCRMLLLRESGPLTGEGLSYLKGWKNLETLKLTESKVTDAVFPALAAHKRLETICLDSNPLTGRGLKELVSLPGIDYLDLRRTKLSDQNLRAAVGLSAKQLNVNNCPLHGEALESLWTWKRLKSLSVWGTEIDDYGLEQIAKCEGLTDLSLGFCPVTEKGLLSLTKLKLQSLTLTGVTAVNDDVLVALAGMKSLKSLNLIGVNVTDKGMLALSESKLKELEITASTDTVGGLIYFVGNKTIEHIDIYDVREAHVKEIKKRQAAIRAAQKKAGAKHQFFIG